jgi:hypothetical protein
MDNFKLTEVATKKGKFYDEEFYDLCSLHQKMCGTCSIRGRNEIFFKIYRKLIVFNTIFKF